MILLAGSLLAFASCQTVPYAPKRATEQSALLVVPLEFRNETSWQLEHVMSLNFDGVEDSKTGDLLEFGRPFGFITSVAPGDHRITRVLIPWKTSGQILHQMALNTPFTVKAGMVSILPMRFSLWFKSDGAYLSTTNLLPNQVAEIRAELQEYRNIETWTMEPQP
ncbi:MAG: hypothetical protein NTU62_04075 [Spirochaetes bacterium]|nr:hypothetical protein [Spirochaetota bacterium]